MTTILESDAVLERPHHCICKQELERDGANDASKHSIGRPGPICEHWRFIVISADLDKSNRRQHYALAPAKTAASSNSVEIQIHAERRLSC